MSRTAPLRSLCRLSCVALAKISDSLMSVGWQQLGIGGIVGQRIELILIPLFEMRICGAGRGADSNADDSLKSNEQ